MTRNAEVARRLEEIADLLAAKDVEYKPRAYRRAAENVRDYHGAVESLAADGPESLTAIEGVGDAIAEKIAEYVETGTIEELESLREEYPIDVEAITSVEGVGPKTAGALYEALDVRTLDDLEAAAEAGEIREVEGFGPKTEENILDGIDFARQAGERQLLGKARPYGESVEGFLADVPTVEEVALAGSLRRWLPTIGDVDVLAASDEGEAVVEAFTDWPEADTVIEAGDTRASVRADGVRVDLRVVVTGEFGSALQYFTGSKDHNVALRNRAIRRGLKMNEYGTFDVGEVEDVADADVAEDGADEAGPEDGDDDVDAGDSQRAGERVAGDTEASMYEALDLPWIPPELRENRGEIEAAATDELPNLLESGDVRGDLHTHTNWSDGGNTIEEMAEGAAALGYEYVAITDHATGPGTVADTGLPDDELREQLQEIRAVDDDVEIDVFAGVEANVGRDGSVSVADDLLADLDVVVASPHAGLGGDGTDRLVDAARHPEVDVIGHPTGRYINERQGLDVDIERLASAAADAGTALEINANPRRLDLSGAAAKVAVEAGATLAINTDAHAPASFQIVRYGVHTARRGWAEPGDVLNAWPLEDVRAFLDLE